MIEYNKIIKEHVVVSNWIVPVEVFICVLYQSMFRKKYY